MCGKDYGTKLLMHLMPTQAFILVGGRGTRLGSLVDRSPKPMLKVNGKPVLDYVISWLQKNGITQVILLAGYLGKEIENYYFKNNLNIDLKVIIEDSPLGTGGSIFSVIEMMKDNFLVCNGDSICPFNFKNFKAANMQGSTLFLSKEKNPIRYGVIGHQNGKVIKFNEEESMQGIFDINTGIYAFNKADFINYGSSPSSLETDFLPQLVSKGILYCEEVKKDLLDIGIPEDYNRAGAFLKENNLLEF